MRPTPYVASLRVYEPLKSFAPDDQFRWEQISVSLPTGFEEQKDALRRTIATQRLGLKPDGAHILEINGEKFIAPWSTSTRCWAALEDFKSSLPPALVNYFLSQKIEDAINVDSEIAEDKVSHIITATWSIPPRWFALFEPSDRIRGSNDDGAYPILRTTIANARQRCLFAHQAARGRKSGKTQVLHVPGVQRDARRCRAFFDPCVPPGWCGHELEDGSHHKGGLWRNSRLQGNCRSE